MASSWAHEGPFGEIMVASCAHEGTSGEIMVSSWAHESPVGEIVASRWALELEGPPGLKNALPVISWFHVGLTRALPVR